MRFIDLVKPFVGYIPEVEAPLKRVGFNDKLMWTVWGLFVYLVCCQVPLFGVGKQESTGSMEWLEVILASRRGTIMELGLSPIITAGLILQFLQGVKIIDVNMQSKEDRELFQAAQKIFGLGLTFTQAVAYVLSGMYGPVGTLGLFKAGAIVAQLMMASFLVLMLDELLQKGYGLGSGISLFIATNVCEQIIWKSLSFSSIKVEDGTEYEGALIAFFHFLLVKPNKLYGMKQAFFRSNGPNLVNLFATVIIMLAVFYLMVSYQFFHNQFLHNSA